uniref:CHP-rich zinc finger protein n=1 Tax=Solanum tuberosum TaxID=4113 RepID=M1CTU5_SOLTU
MKYQDNQHFSHHHILKKLVLDENEELQCQACEKFIFEPFHGCISCNFYLHDNCLNAPRSLVHPSHLSHPLTLLPTPTYSCRSFTCNACGSEGRSCSLSCAHCEFDLHVQCAVLPQTVLLDQHQHHELKLIFDSSFGDEDESFIFVCDFCNGKVEENSWLYYCADCDFGTHIECSSISKYVNKPKDNAVITKPNEELVISKSTKSPVTITEKKTAKNPKMKLVVESPVKKLVDELSEAEENAVIMKPNVEEPINNEITEQVFNTSTEDPVRKTEKKFAKSVRVLNPKMKTVEKSQEENAEILKPKEVPTTRKTKKKSDKNPGANHKRKPVSESSQDENSADKLREGEEGEESSELTYYEAQCRLKEQHMKNMIILQAMDNAASYVGPSGSYYYY